MKSKLSRKERKEMADITRQKMCKEIYRAISTGMAASFATIPSGIIKDGWKEGVKFVSLKIDSWPQDAHLWKQAILMVKRELENKLKGAGKGGEIE